MKNSILLFRACFAAACALLFCAVAVAQQKPIAIEDWYGEVKTTLAKHYTGKSVRTKLPIPDARRGLEMIDGAVRNEPASDPKPLAAQIGEELVIKEVEFDDNAIRFAFAKNEPPPKRSIANPLALPTRPKISLRFSRELTSKDLTIESINRLLAVAIDTSLLQPTATTAASAPSVNATSAPAPDTNSAATAKIPMPEIVRNIGPADTTISELSVEAAAAGARVYIDGAYSGVAPRTLRLRAGAHTIMIVADGFAPWEQRLFFPGGKSSIIRADLQKN